MLALQVRKMMFRFIESSNFTNNSTANETVTDEDDEVNLPQLSGGHIAAIVVSSLFTFIAVPMLIFYLLPEKNKIRIISFVKKGLLWNCLVLTSFVVMASLFIAGVTAKWTGGSNDNTVDYCKLFIVWLNVNILLLLLFQKRVFIGATVRIQVCYGAVLVALYVMLFLNLSILIITASPDYTGNGQPLTAVPYNRDYLVFAATIMTDLVYLSIYILFRSKRAIVAALMIITIEIIILGWSVHNATDFAVDTSNLALSFVSGSLAVIMWTAEVKFTNEGLPLDFKDFAIRDDLDESYDGFLVYEK